MVYRTGSKHVIEKAMAADQWYYASFKSITFLFEMSMSISEDHIIFSFSCELLLMHFLI